MFLPRVGSSLCYETSRYEQTLFVVLLLLRTVKNTMSRPLSPEVVDVLDSRADLSFSYIFTSSLFQITHDVVVQEVQVL